MGCGCDERRRKLKALASRFQQKVADYLSAKETSNAQASRVQAQGSLDEDHAAKADHRPALAQGQGQDPRP